MVDFVILFSLLLLSGVILSYDSETKDQNS